MRTHRGAEIGARVQAAIDKAHLSRNEVARRAAIEPSRLAKFCHGKLPLAEGELAAVARAVDAKLPDLLGLQVQDDSSITSENAGAPSPMSEPYAMREPVPDRMGDGRRAYIEGHRDELSERDIEWLQRVRVGIDGGQDVEPEGERFWQALLDWHHREEIRRRDSGS